MCVPYAILTVDQNAFIYKFQMIHDQCISNSSKVLNGRLLSHRVVSSKVGISKQVHNYWSTQSLFDLLDVSLTYLVKR